MCSTTFEQGIGSLYVALQPKGQFHDDLLFLFLKQDLNRIQYIPFY